MSVTDTDGHTILHISDLHRTADQPVHNDTLLALLLRDRDRYSAGPTASLSPPQSIIVSGDIVQGALQGASDWNTDLHAQYLAAEDFLIRLTEKFLDGDRSRVALVPGNHDVCWNTSFAAMEEVPADKVPNDVLRALRTPRSDFR